MWGYPTRRSSLSPITRLGLGMYFLGSWIVWLVLGAAGVDWHNAARAGAVVALIGLVLILPANLIRYGGTGFSGTITWASAPIGIIVWSNTSDGGLAVKTTIWLVVIGVILSGLIQLARRMGD
jgi:hypothetical protein